MTAEALASIESALTFAFIFLRSRSTWGQAGRVEQVHRARHRTSAAQNRTVIHVHGARTAIRAIHKQRAGVHRRHTGVRISTTERQRTAAHFGQGNVVRTGETNRA